MSRACPVRGLSICSFTSGCLLGGRVDGYEGSVFPSIFILVLLLVLLFLPNEFVSNVKVGEGEDFYSSVSCH